MGRGGGGLGALIGGAFLLVIGGIIFFTMMGAVVDSLAASGAPWYVWLVIAAAIIGMIASDVSEIVSAGGVIFGILVIVFGALTHDWIAIATAVVALIISALAS